MPGLGKALSTVTKRVLIGNTIALEYFAILAKWPRVCLPPGLFLNVRKIRVDSDNKR
jgi:hypothetical protein